VVAKSRKKLNAVTPIVVPGPSPHIVDIVDRFFRVNKYLPAISGKQKPAMNEDS